MAAGGKVVLVVVDEVVVEEGGESVVVVTVVVFKTVVVGLTSSGVCVTKGAGVGLVMEGFILSVLNGVEVGIAVCKILACSSRFELSWPDSFGENKKRPPIVANHEKVIIRSL